MKIAKEIAGYFIIYLFLLLFTVPAFSHCEPCPPCYTGAHLFNCIGCTYHGCPTCNSADCMYCNYLCQCQSWLAEGWTCCGNGSYCHSEQGYTCCPDAGHCCGPGATCRGDHCCPTEWESCGSGCCDPNNCEECDGGQCKVCGGDPNKTCCGGNCCQYGCCEEELQDELWCISRGCGCNPVVGGSCSDKKEKEAGSTQVYYASGTGSKCRIPQGEVLCYRWRSCQGTGYHTNEICNVLNPDFPEGYCTTWIWPYCQDCAGTGLWRDEYTSNSERCQ